MATTRTKMPWDDVLELGRGEQLVAQSRFGAQRAEAVPVPEALHPALAEALARTGVEELYSHQAEAYESAMRGDTIVTTGTASGKSLAFNLPVLDTLARDPRARALYLYPTKALAQDQARKLHDLRAPFLRHAIYDGDTPREERRGIRSRSNLILTNPDMLNVGVLPHHRQWGDVLANLAWIVVDEAHVYRGVFGSHVANVLRRLRRLARAYGTEPRCMLTSATIANPVELAERIAAYRAGYTPMQRREIERRLAEGELLAVVATNALELGIDVGELDAAVCVNYPGTVASLLQMWGRAGRRRTGLAMYIAGDDALDQFFCRHPDEFLERPVESAILDYESEGIHLPHLVAAAYELPLTPEDADILGPRWEAYAERLVRIGELRGRGGRYMPTSSEFVAGRISLRSASLDSYAVVEERAGEVIGTVEAGRAFSTVHPGAVYMHLGQSYGVDELDIRSRRALVHSFNGDWYTQPKKETETFIEEVRAQRMLGDVELNFGVVSVSEQVVAFQKKSVGSHESLDLLPVDLPEEHFVTQALWYVMPDKLLREDFPLDVLQGSLHAAEHAQIAVLPLIAMCDRWDIGGLSTAFHHQTGRPTIFIYDGHPGGVGITFTGYHAFERLTDDARRLIEECPCQSGCPSCVQSPKCGNLNEPLNKNGAVELLKRVQAV